MAANEFMDDLRRASVARRSSTNGTNPEVEAKPGLYRRPRSPMPIALPNGNHAGLPTAPSRRHTQESKNDTRGRHGDTRAGGGDAGGARAA